MQNGKTVLLEFRLQLQEQWPIGLESGEYGGYACIETIFLVKNRETITAWRVSGECYEKKIDLDTKRAKPREILLQNIFIEFCVDSIAPRVQIFYA